MSATEALRAARAVGIYLGVDGDDLVLEAPAAPPADVLDLLARHKPAVVALLRPGGEGWSAEEWQGFFDDRAGIIQFEGGLSRTEAEARAFEICIVEWLNRNPQPSAPERCARCLSQKSENATIVPFGVGEAHTWLHPECWPAWDQARKAQAAAALIALGIVPAGDPAFQLSRKHPRTDG
jgi:hypothetical protein